MSDLGVPGDTGADVSANTGSEPAQQTDTTQQDQGNGLNPAWQPLMEVLPTQFVPQVTPILQQWDKGVQDRFQTVQSTYAPYKPFIDQGIAPENLQAAHALMQALEANPREFYDKMGQYYAQEWGLDQGLEGSDDADDYSLDDLDDEDQGPIDLGNNPLIQQIQQQQDTIAQILTTQYQQQQEAQQQQIQAQAAQEVETEVAEIEKKYGPLNKDQAEFIFGLAINSENITLQQAADRYFATAGGAKPNSSAIIMSPGGGVPANNVDVANLNGQDRRSMVAKILEEAHRANQT